MERVTTYDNQKKQSSLFQYVCIFKAFLINETQSYLEILVLNMYN